MKLAQQREVEEYKLLFFGCDEFSSDSADLSLPGAILATVDDETSTDHHSSDCGHWRWRAGLLSLWRKYCSQWTATTRPVD